LSNSEYDVHAILERLTALLASMRTVSDAPQNCRADDKSNKQQTKDPTDWVSIDRHPLVVSGEIKRDALYRLAHEKRIRVVKLSARRWLIPLNFLNEIAE
jgi:hypothetical protein